MLLRDTAAADEAGGAKVSTSASSATVWRFIKAVVNTKSLAKPPYIVMSRDQQLS